VTLTTVGLAALAVAVVFLVWAWLVGGRPTRLVVLVVVGEALLVTLLAALWFGSLGRGGWLTLFLLLGLLVSGAERGLRIALLRSGGAKEFRHFALGVARYLAAGAVLAWRLG
jgi:hypothetical protein